MAMKGYAFCIESNNEEIVNTPALTTLIKENLKEYCDAAHSQTQNKDFLSDENQHPIFI